MKRSSRSSVAFTLAYTSEHAAHSDRFLVSKVDFWRDVFPGSMSENVQALYPGETYTEVFAPGVLVPPFDEKLIFTFKKSLFESPRGGKSITPRLGRFYPRSYAWRGVNSFKANFNPFRCIAHDHDQMVADTNSPLARYPLSLTAKCIERLAEVEEHGGSCNDIAEVVTLNGPGMQVLSPGTTTDFYHQYPFQRLNDADDALYYTAPRFVHHLDAVARREVTEIYAAHLRNGTAILDLMSSWNSHLPDSLEGCTVVGLGLNREEMEHNSRLSEIVIHDLNRNKRLPFKENTFDTVICTASIEYLTHPLEVINEVARVLRPQGKFITTFSDRWFPGKEISLWSELHEFERLGLVLDMYRQTGCFSQLETKSVRGLPRPANDPHISTRLLSDPVFSICGVRAPSSPVSGRSRLTV